MKPAGFGEVAYLNIRNFSEDGILTSNLHPDLHIRDVPEKHLLKAGDVLFASKGTKNFATVYGVRDYHAVASTSFFVIRLTDNRVLPKYLAWFLNTQSMQTQLKAQATGSSILSIPKHVLENLEMTIPSLERQELVLKITKLHEKEKALKQEIETLREKYIYSLLFLPHQQ